MAGRHKCDTQRMVARIVFALFSIALFASAQPPVEGTPATLASLRYIDITQGTGADAASGKRFTVHYTGWLKDGTKFDSSVDRNEPFQFTQGRRQVIVGWDIGFEGMKVGGKRRLFIPYELAYGTAGNATIPPKAELTFDIELLAVDDAITIAPGMDILAPFMDLETRVLDLARAIPAEKYSWRPADPNSRTIAQIFMRISDAAQLLDALAGEDIKPAELEGKLAEKAQAAPPDKETILRQLATNFATVHKDMQDAGNGILGDTTEMLGQPITRRGILVWLDTTIAEQLGQATVYAHDNGIGIPWAGAPLR